MAAWVEVVHMDVVAQADGPQATILHIAALLEGVSPVRDLHPKL